MNVSTVRTRTQAGLTAIYWFYQVSGTGLVLVGVLCTLFGLFSLASGLTGSLAVLAFYALRTPKNAAGVAAEARRRILLMGLVLFSTVFLIPIAMWWYADAGAYFPVKQLLLIAVPVIYGPLLLYWASDIRTRMSFVCEYQETARGTAIVKFG